MDPAKEIDLAVCAQLKSINDIIARGDSEVQQFYRDTTVFITGGTGFIGRQLIEKLLRSCAIKKIYLLLRTRKNKTIQERLKKLQEDSVYDSLREKQPRFADKIVALKGDISDIRLGLDDEVWETLAEEVNIIFHVAATVRFDEPLRNATLINVRGTREVLALAKDCKYFKHLVHISTAFSHATKDRKNEELLESFYPCGIPPQTLIDLAENVQEDRLNDITSGLIGTWPNTYTFTKSVAEELIRINAGDLPVCIVRPAMVLAAYLEPSPGWLDLRSVMGTPSGMYLGSTLGVIHVILSYTDTIVNIVPLDYVNNAIIASAWNSAQRRNTGNEDIPIYTISKPCRYGMVSEVCHKEKHRIISPKAVWRCHTFQFGNIFIYKMGTFFMHYVPAFLLDLLLKFAGKKLPGIPSLVSIYKKLDNLSIAYYYFIQNEFTIRNDNIHAMFTKMTEADKKIFNFNLLEFNFEDYLVVWCIGLRKYIIKDKLEGTTIGYRNQKIFRILNYIVVCLYVYCLWFLFKTVFNVVQAVILYFC